MPEPQPNSEDKNGSSGKWGAIISLLIGIVGFATALITNADKLNELLALAKTPQTSRIPGKWTGVFREYVSEKEKDLITTEVVRLQMHGSTISGEIDTADNKSREWKITGEVFPGDDALTINYVTKDAKRKSIGAYVLTYDQLERTYFGYWLGYDPDLQRVVAYPYILTQEEANVTKHKYAKYLNQPALNYKP